MVKPTLQPMGYVRPSGQIKVVVVDDEPSILHSTAALLRDLDYEVATCDDPAHILATLDAEKPDILLQDVRMPGLDIEKLVHTIRETHEDLPIVLFTAGMDADEVAARVRANAVLEKPFRPAQLVSALTRVLPTPA